jgi:hypothetical protein
MSDLNVVLIWGLILAFYFLPALVANARCHHQFAAIAVMNLLLGWTAIGWIAALIWAATAVREERA